ncbi:MAG: hypothetical protein JWO25_1918 [Alphaproteobacteria bacterium]|nr:hypothetical protein [Alphaproteobacteria bacterium]
MRSVRSVGATVPIFVSAKTTAAVPAGLKLLYDALVQSTLDPRVRSIDYFSGPSALASGLADGDIVITRHDGRFLLEVETSRPTDRPASSTRTALPLLTLTAAQIRRGPRYANSQHVWNYRTQPVTLALRLQVLQILGDEGPCRLGSLLPAIRTNADPAAALFALACQDLVELDLDSQPVGPATVARTRA